MKKIFFFAAIAALALSSCSSDELVQAEQPVEDGAVTFSAYAGRANRALAMTNTELGELGFGVFAYEQGNVAWDTYRAGNTYPNFMYNQKVSETVTAASKYEFGTKPITNLLAYISAPAAIKALYNAPAVKAYTTTPVYTDAQKDALVALGWKDSEGAFTAESKSLTWEQFESLSASLWPHKSQQFILNGDLVAAAGAKFTLTHELYNALPADAQEYYTYTAATVTDNTWAYSPIKYFSNNVDAKHSFFAYAPYQQDVKAVFTENGPAVRYSTADDYDLLWGKSTSTSVAWVNTLKQGVSDKIDLSFQHALSKVSFAATYFVDEIHGADAHNANGNFKDENTTVVIRSVKFIGQVPSQGLLNLYDGSWTYEKIEESACEIVSGVTFSWDGVADASGNYKPLKNNMTVIPTQAGDKVRIQIVYDVITKDYSNPKNNSTVTNTITSQDAYELVQGKAYTFKLDLGLTSVKFNASVTLWGSPDEEYVDLPNNLPYSLVSPLKVTKVVSDVPTGTDTAGAYAFDSANKHLYQYSSTWTQVTTSCPVVYADSNYYVSEEDNGTYKLVTATASSIEELKTKESGYYTLGDKLYKVVK